MASEIELRLEDGGDSDERVFVVAVEGDRIIQAVSPQLEGEIVRVPVPDSWSADSKLIAGNSHRIGCAFELGQSPTSASIRLEPLANYTNYSDIRILNRAVDVLRERPRAHTYPGRQSTEDVPTAEGHVAGRPGDKIPVNEVGYRHTARYLTLDAAGATGLSPIDWGKGRLIEFEITFEPIGWALDDWIDTLALSPGEETATSESLFSSSADQTAEDRNTLLDERSQVRSDGATTDEVMSLMSNTIGTSRGVQIGLKPAARSGPTIALDPVSSLVQAVTGAVQLGFSSAEATADSQTSGSLRTALQSSLRQATGQLRSSQASRSAKTVTGLSDTRRLRIFRNPSTGRALNLAVFSVSRQWLVTTAVARERTVVLAPIRDRDRPFSELDVFVHRDTLSGILLDPLLSDDLESVASSFGHTPPSEPPLDVVAKYLSGTIYFGAEASGLGSTVRLRPVFEDGPSGDPALLRVFEQTDSGTSRWFQIEVDRPLRQFRGVELVYDNPGIAVAGPAKVSRLRVEVVAASDERFLLMDIVDLELPRNEERFIGNNFRVPLTTSIRRSFDSAVVRILTHLNHNRHFYRLALDLQQDAVSRYIDVHARVPGWVERPSDMNPVGVAGAHLAFFTADDGITPAADYDRAFISTPSGSTFVELMQGQVGLPVDNQAASSLPAKDGSLGWPEPYLPAAPAALASSIGSLNGASHETGGQPTAVSSKLSEKVDSLALASKIAEVLAQALASAGDAAGKKEEESAGAVENEESGEGPDGADAEEGAEGRKENE